MPPMPSSRPLAWPRLFMADLWKCSMQLWSAQVKCVVCSASAVEASKSSCNMPVLYQMRRVTSCRTAAQLEASLALSETPGATTLPSSICPVQALQQMHKILGQVDIVGVPFTLGSSLFEGFSGLIMKPAQAKSPAEFFDSLGHGLFVLFRNALFGVLHAFGQVRPLLLIPSRPIIILC